MKHPSTLRTGYYPIRMPPKMCLLKSYDEGFGVDILESTNVHRMMKKYDGEI